MSIQDIRFNAERPNSYMSLANNAVEFEKKGLWELASDAWDLAKKAARRDVNRAWAQHRIDFCLVAKCREWKAPTLKVAA